LQAQQPDVQLLPAADAPVVRAPQPQRPLPRAPAAVPPRERFAPQPAPNASGRRAAYRQAQSTSPYGRHPPGGPPPRNPASRRYRASSSEFPLRTAPARAGTGSPPARGQPVG